MKKTMFILSRCMKQTIRNKERLMIILLIPTLFIVGIAWLYGDESSFVIIGDTGNAYNIGVINYDQLPTLNSSVISSIESNISSNDLLGSPFPTGFGDHLIDNINDSNELISDLGNKQIHLRPYSDYNKATTAVQSRFISLCFIIPENFSNTVLAGINYRIKVINNITLLDDAQFYYSESIIGIIGDYTYARFSESFTLVQDVLNNYLDSYWLSGIDQPGKLSINNEHLTTLTFTEFDIFVPAFLIFAIISSSTGVAGIIGFERDDGTIDRLILSKFSTQSYLFGLTLTQIMTSLLTMMIIIPTIYLLGFPLQGLHQIPYILFVTVLATLPLLGISLGFAALLDGRMATYLPSLLAIPLTFLTGNFIPLPRISLIGDIQLWHINPFFCAGEFLRKTLVVNLDFTYVIVDMIMLLVSGGFIFMIGSIFFLKSIYSK